MAGMCPLPSMEEQDLVVKQAPEPMATLVPCHSLRMGKGENQSQEKNPTTAGGGPF